MQPSWYEMNAQIAPRRTPALDSNAQHGLSQLEVHLAVHDHSSWHQGVNHRWFGLTVSAIFFHNNATVFGNGSDCSTAWFYR